MGKIKTKKSEFEISVIGKYYIVTETYIREFEIGDIVKNGSEIYEILEFRFEPIQGGAGWMFEYIVKQITGIRECPVGWTDLYGFKIIVNRIKTKNHEERTK